MKSITAICLLLLVMNSFAVNIQERIDSQNYFLSVYPDLFGDSDFALQDDFKTFFNLQSDRKKNDAMFIIRALEKTVPEKILMPLVYWKIFKSDSKRASNIISYFALYKLMVIRDYLDNPFVPKVEKKLLIQYLKNIGMNRVDSFKIFDFFKKNIESRVKSYAKSRGHQLTSEILSDKLLGANFLKIFNFLPKYSLTKFGIIPGNQVKIFSTNTRTLERISWYNEHVIFHGGKLDWSQPYMKMPMSPTDEGHIAFKTDPIFIQIRDMIHKSKESIFIDIFLFGGTLGGTIAKFLLDEVSEKIKKNPKFRVLMMHDYATNYNMLPEMLPIFVYIRDRILDEKIFYNHFYFLQANIQRHPPGVPFGITNYLEKTPELFREIEKRSTYYESKIDHSKVLVIDANTDSPEAYFGSKNWSDHSGGYYYDDVIWIKGPAAALVQASYFDDVDAALTDDPKELEWFYYKEKGLDNKKYLSQKKEILDWFAINKNDYPEVGSEKVRFAEANVDGRIKNVRNILVDMIIHSKDHIYMEELFVYDKYINDALIKKKLQNPDMDIRIIADHNGNFGLNGFPNTIFMKELVDQGIKVRARRTFGVTAHFPDGAEQEYHQENHRKILSVDGEVLLGGSSNFNPDTLQGSFREFGAQIYSKKEIEKFEKNFLLAWDDEKQTMPSDIDNFQLKVGKKLFDVKTSNLINKFVSLIYRSKDYLEKRH